MHDELRCFRQNYIMKYHFSGYFIVKIRLNRSLKEKEYLFMIKISFDIKNIVHVYILNI